MGLTILPTHALEGTATGTQKAFVVGDVGVLVSLNPLSLLTKKSKQILSVKQIF